MTPKAKGQGGPKRRDVWEFISKDAPSGCWLWMGGVTSSGYGNYYTPDRRRTGAHRYMYELLVGPIPEGLQIDHLCRVRNCVNPEHMEPVTLRENLARSTNLASIAIRFNTCMRGHELTEDNFYRIPSRPTERRCRTCHNMRQREAKARRAKAG